MPTQRHTFISRTRLDNEHSVIQDLQAKCWGPFSLPRLLTSKKSFLHGLAQSSLPQSLPWLLKRKDINLFVLFCFLYFYLLKNVFIYSDGAFKFLLLFLYPPHLPIHPTICPFIFTLENKQANKQTRILKKKK